MEAKVGRVPRERPERFRGVEYAGIPDSFLVDLDAIGPPEPVTLPRTFVDWSKFWEGGYHTLLQGRTGAGKTTLLLNLLWRLHTRGHRILLRDDGGLDFLFLAEYVPMTVWVPAGCSFSLQHPELYDIEVRGFEGPGDILDEIYDSPYRFHSILYDCYCSDPAPAAGFYSEVFRELIFRCMQTERAVKEPLVFSFDELNDLVQPKGMELTKGHTSIRSMVEYNVRKLRKHRVTLIASTHRFNQIGINVRSQFSYIMIKQSYGKDVYDFISHNLITAANEGFWATLRTLTTMGPEYVYVFDYKNSYDRLRVPDIPRPVVRYRLEGEIAVDDDPRQYDIIDLVVAVARARCRCGREPESFQSIAARVGRSKSTIGQRANKLRKLHLLGEAMA